MVISLASLRSILVSILLTFGTDFSSAGTYYYTPNTKLKFHAQEKRIHELRLGERLTLELRGGEVHSYQVVLSSGQYLRVTVEQKGIDVVVMLFGTDHEPLTEVDSPNGTQGPESVSVIARNSGNYSLRVKSLDVKAGPGRYELKVEELRESNYQDRLRINAQFLLAEGTEFYAKGTAEDLQKAIEKYMEALPILRAIGDQWKEGLALSSIGLFYSFLGESKKALEYYNKALPLRHAVGDRAGEAVTLHNMGSAYHSLGKLQEALNYYNRALPLLLKVGDKVGEADTHNSIASLFRELGEPVKALEILAQALLLEDTSGDRRAKAQTLNRMGEVYAQLSDWQKALRHFDQALSLRRELGDKTEEAVSIGNIGLVYLSLGDPKKALEYCNQALLLFRVAGYRMGEALMLSRIGLAHSLLGNAEEGWPYLERAVTLNRALSNKRNEAITLAYLATVERGRGRLTEARTQIEASLNIAEDIRSRLVSQELRTSYLGSTRSRYEFYIDLLMEMHRGQPSSGYDAAALEANERARARSLLETLTEARADIREGVSASLLQRERNLQEQLNAKSVALLSLVSDKRPEEKESGLRKELEILLTDYRNVEAQIRAASPRYAALTRPQPLSLKEIQLDILDEDTLLLEYALGEDRSYLWAVSADSFRSFELPKGAEIEAKARRVYDLIISKADAQHPEALADLSRTLLGPVADQLGNKRLLIVGEGALQYVPFGALPKPLVDPEQSSSKLRSPNKYEPLILDHEIAYSPSASVVGVLRQRETSAGTLAANQQLLVFADPVFVKEDQRVKSARGLRTGKGIRRTAENDPTSVAYVVERSAKHLGLSKFDRLANSRREAELIAKQYPQGQSRKALDFEANRSIATSPAVAQYRILHFATHSLLNNNHPELSGIVLSLVDELGNPQDGFVRLHEIYNLKLSADLVVLSACQTALGKDIKGEGLVGLTRGFMYAGAARVVASLWRVSDSATAELMTRFYQNMLTGKMRPAAALRAAQLSLFKEKQWAAAYYWAGFIHQGEWR